MNCKMVVCLLFALSLAACRGQVPTGSEEAPVSALISGQATASESDAMEESQKQDARAVLEAVLKAGMAYADFRKQALAQGWTPVQDDQCASNVAGRNHQTVCSQNPNLAACKVCNQMTELSTCSGDGHCLVRFRHETSGESLDATGYGMIEDWSVSGEDSRLQLSKWSFARDSAR